MSKTKSQNYVVLCTCPILGEVRNAGDEVELNDEQAKRCLGNGTVQLLTEFKAGQDALVKAKAEQAAKAAMRKKAAEAAQKEKS